MKTKKSLLLALLVFTTTFLSAQTEKKQQRIDELPELEMTQGVNIHFISPEPIQFVDLSTDNIVGDLPSENIARVKIVNPKGDTISKSETLPFYEGERIGIITIVGQSFMAQYRAIYKKNTYNTQSNIQIQPENMQPLEFPKMKFSNMELRKLSMDIITQKAKKPLKEVNKLKLSIKLNNVYVMNDYIFLDVSFENKTNLSYDIESIKYSIEDKKIYKATNNQSIELKPVYQLYKPTHFKKSFRNIYVFKKFTYPNSKIMKIRLLEEQLSGRMIEMKIHYSDILNADTF
ncbi:conjugative transposon protein TraN [Riemerella anatipestifer]|uniref:conjugative transposon protein TraN n=1 Tax=Riemerella anatipestifer TaxID=34085 RepID=UPI00069B1996|nr:conjugative transposon protein TraN [Riemerella anatipestifer]MDR7693392.1 conjugative transposon protein TraN [Riemerella anatipestifer]MDY3528867.1 conjugative transposon protein TraN [Riemerella anatipestifer]MDY3538082.1 conjugative transposon protein TraN [Riemerella anatipestifer]